MITGEGEILNHAQCLSRLVLADDDLILLFPARTRSNTKVLLIVLLCDGPLLPTKMAVIEGVEMGWRSKQQPNFAYCKSVTVIQRSAEFHA